MKQLISIGTAGLIFLFAISSCNDFLDVQPRDQFLETQVFESESGINSALNGIYLRMARNSLYGGNMTMTTVEVLGQQYNLSIHQNNVWRQHSEYNYNTSNVESTMEEIWSEAYVRILNLNTFIEQLSSSEGIVTADKKSLLLGEAYGLRAFLHFDLLRLFGPIYSLNPDGDAIPYYTVGDAEVTEILPASQAIDSVLADLETAEQLLADDPVIDNGVQHVQENDGDDFYRWRNYHMNHYAVKAMQARVNLYAGNDGEALAAAEYVIQENETKGWFPWIDPGDVYTESQNPDRVFSSEVLFGVQNLDMYSLHSQTFSGDVDVTDILAPEPSRLSNTYESNENDYRYNPWWKIPSTGGKPYRTFFKFADIIDSGLEFRFLQPLIRISEMYYIAAETHPDENTGREYLNTVRFNRGLGDLGSGVDLQAEIEKEYAKEFYGEGQMFFYYKRHAVTEIEDGSSSSGTINMDEEEYVVPLPDSEIEYRN